MLKLKSVILVVFAAVLSMSMTGCADLIMAVSAPIRNMRVSVDNTMPWPLNQVGTAGTRVSIENPQPYYALLVNTGQKYPVCVIPPGGSAVDDNWDMNIPHKVLSLVAIFYRDAQCTQWVGMRMRVLNVEVGQESKWILNYVTRPDNNGYSDNAYGVPVHPLTELGGERHVTIFGPSTTGANYVTIANCTYYTMIVRRDGRRVAAVPPGWVYPLYDTHAYGNTRVDFTMWFVDDRGVNYGYVDFPVTLTQYGPVANQMLVTAQDIRRVN